MISRSPSPIFVVHLGLYLVVNAGIAAATLMQPSAEGEARELWFQLLLAGWGIGVAAHGLALLLRRRGEAGGLLAEAPVRGVAVHLFIYVAANALLIAINLTKGSDTLWLVWPLIGWGVGIAAHAVLVYRAVTTGMLRRYATEQRILGDIQAARLAERHAAAAAAKGKAGGQPPKTARPPRKKAPARSRKPAPRKRGKE